MAQKPKPEGKLFAGTSGWAYPSWRPGFYPERLAPKKFLEHYATRLNSVEVNYTFTKLPTATMMSQWLAATPKDFRFTFKAPQQITHRKRLVDCDGLVAEFLAAIAPARDTGKMGALLFQLPPNFKLNLDRLATFLNAPTLRNTAGGSGPHVAFEFRHEAWFVPEVFELLRQHGAALCRAESDDLVTPEVSTAAFSYYRLRRSGYTQPTVRKLAAKLQQEAAGCQVYAYFKHEDLPHGALHAEALLRKSTAPGKARR